jgi:hypothetical protein
MNDCILSRPVNLDHPPAILSRFHSAMHKSGEGKKVIECSAFAYGAVGTLRYPKQRSDLVQRRTYVMNLRRYIVGWLI